jgi:hypothetical protein
MGSSKDANGGILYQSPYAENNARATEIRSTSHQAQQDGYA